MTIKMRLDEPGVISVSSQVFTTIVIDSTNLYPNDQANYEGL